MAACGLNHTVAITLTRVFAWGLTARSCCGAPRRVRVRRCPHSRARCRLRRRCQLPLHADVYPHFRARGGHQQGEAISSGACEPPACGHCAQDPTVKVKARAEVPRGVDVSAGKSHSAALDSSSQVAGRRARLPSFTRVRPDVDLGRQSQGSARHRTAQTLFQAHRRAAAACPPPARPPACLAAPQRCAFLAEYARLRVVVKFPQPDIKVKAIACGTYHTLALTTTGSGAPPTPQPVCGADGGWRTRPVWSWGSNEQGQLGIGGGKNVDRPVLIDSLQGAPASARRLPSGRLALDSALTLAV
jgi:alpha-tubulin suppressor-like RCC1 family protein